MRNVSNGRASGRQTSADKVVSSKVRVVRPCKSEHNLSASSKAVGSPTRPTLRRRDTLPTLRSDNDRTKSKTKQSTLISPGGALHLHPPINDPCSYSSNPKTKPQMEKGSPERPTPWLRGSLEDIQRPHSRFANKSKAENTTWPSRAKSCSPRQRPHPRSSELDNLLSQDSKIGDILEGAISPKAKVHENPTKSILKGPSKHMRPLNTPEPSHKLEQQVLDTPSFTSKAIAPIDASSDRHDDLAHDSPHPSMHESTDPHTKVARHISVDDPRAITDCQRWVTLARIHGLDMGVHQPADFMKPFKRYFPTSVQQHLSLPTARIELPRPIKPVHVTTAWMGMTLEFAKELYRIHEAFTTSVEQILEEQLSRLYSDLQHEHQARMSDSEKPFTGIMERYVFVRRQELMNLLMLKLHGMQPQDDFTIAPTGLLALYLAVTECFFDCTGNDPGYFVMTLRTCFNKAEPLNDTYIEAGWTPDSVFFNDINTQPREGQELIIAPHYQCNSPFRSGSKPHVVRYSTDAPWLIWCEDSHCFRGFVPCFSGVADQNYQSTTLGHDTTSYPIDVAIEAVLVEGYSVYGDSRLWFERAVRTRIHFSVIAWHSKNAFESAVHTFLPEGAMSGNTSSLSPAVLTSAYGAMNELGRLQLSPPKDTHTSTQSKSAGLRTAHSTKSTDAMMMHVARKHAFLAERLADLAQQHAEAEKLCLELCSPVIEDPERYRDLQPLTGSMSTEHNPSTVRDRPSHSPERNGARPGAFEKVTVPGEPKISLGRNQAPSLSSDLLIPTPPNSEPGDATNSRFSTESTLLSLHGSSTSNGEDEMAAPEISRLTVMGVEQEDSRNQPEASPYSRSLRQMGNANLADRMVGQGGHDFVGKDGNLPSDSTEAQEHSSKGLHVTVTTKKNDLPSFRTVSKPLEMPSVPLSLRDEAANRFTVKHCSVMHSPEEVSVQIAGPLTESTPDSLKLKALQKGAANFSNDKMFSIGAQSILTDGVSMNSGVEAGTPILLHNSYAPPDLYMDELSSASEASDDDDKNSRVKYSPQFAPRTQPDPYPSCLAPYELVNPRATIQYVSPNHCNEVVQKNMKGSPRSQTWNPHMTSQSTVRSHSKKANSSSQGKVGAEHTANDTDSKAKSIAYGQLKIRDTFNSETPGGTALKTPDRSFSSFYSENSSVESNRSISEHLKDLILGGIDLYEQGLIWESIKKCKQFPKVKAAKAHSDPEPKLSQDEKDELEKAKKRSMEDETARKMAACGVPETLDDIFFESATTDQETFDSSEEDTSDTEREGSVTAAEDEENGDDSEDFH